MILHFHLFFLNKNYVELGCGCLIGEEEEEEEAQALSVSSSLDCRNILFTLQISGKSSQ